MSDQTPDNLCYACGSSGVVDTSDWSDCAACEKSGKVLDGVCPCCEGRGLQRVEVKLLCPHCVGTQFVIANG